MNKFGLLGFIVAALIIIPATRRFFEQRKQNEINDHSAVVTYQVTVTEKRIIHTRICVPVSGMWFSGNLPL